MLQTALHWKDFELLDSGQGMKLERWKDVLLARPDPAALWPRDERAPWKQAQAVYRRSPKGGGSWDCRARLPAQWELGYKDLRFIVRPTGFKHTGLFPEQAPNWDWLRGLAAGAGRPLEALNLFGYTGAASLALARAGAAVTHVDAAKGMVQWCRENAALNGLEGARIRTLVDDALKFVEREARRGRKYDLLLMDPPSFGRGSQGETWKIEKHLWPLLEKCRPLLSDKPLALLLTSHSAGLSAPALANLLETLMRGMAGGAESGELGLRQSSNGMTLPCGSFARWSAKG